MWCMCLCVIGMGVYKYIGFFQLFSILSVSFFLSAYLPACPPSFLLSFLPYFFLYFFLSVNQRSVVHHPPKVMYISFGIKRKATRDAILTPGGLLIFYNAVSDLWCIDCKVHQRSVV